MPDFTSVRNHVSRPIVGARMTQANGDRAGDLSRFEQPLSFIPAEDRDTWLRVGMALHAESGGSAAGLDIWSAWSSTCRAKFDEANQSCTWKNFTGNRVTGGTIIRLAHENGYINGDAHTAIKAARPIELPRDKPKPPMPWRCTEDRLIAQGYKFVAGYDYGDAGEKVRFEHSCNKKTFAWRHAVDGRWLNGMRPKTPCQPYGLARLLEHADEVVFVVEGEKDADRLNAEGQVAINVEAGYEHAAVEHLTGRDVFVIPDNDTAGEKRAAAVRAAIEGHAITVRVLRLPGLAEKGDVSDWLNSGNTISALVELTGTAAIEEGNARLAHGFRAPRVGSTPTTADYNVKSIIAATGTGVLYGHSTVGKSFVAVDLCVAVSRGDAWCSQRTKPGVVAYLALEGAQGIEKRFDALMRARELDHLDVMISDGPLDLRDEGSVAKTIASLKALGEERGPVRLLVIDTLACAAPGADMNGPADSSLIVEAKKRIARDAGCFVLTVAHPSKNEAGGIAGNLRFFNDVDTVIKITSDKDNVGTIFIDKVREDRAKYELADFRIVPFELGTDDEGDPITSAIVEWVNEQRTPRDPVADLPPQQRAVLNHLDQLILDGKVQRFRGRDGIPDETDTVALEDLVNRCNDAFDVTTAEDGRSRCSAIGNKIRALQKKSLLHVHAKRVWKISRVDHLQRLQRPATPAPSLHPLQPLASRCNGCNGPLLGAVASVAASEGPGGKGQRDSACESVE